MPGPEPGTMLDSNYVRSYHFLAHGGVGGGGGRNEMKDSVKFFIPPGSSRKIVDPPWKQQKNC